jgi:hypothetical protein
VQVVILFRILSPYKNLKLLFLAAIVTFTTISTVAGEETAEKAESQCIDLLSVVAQLRQQNWTASSFTKKNPLSGIKQTQIVSIVKTVAKEAYFTSQQFHSTYLQYCEAAGLKDHAENYKNAQIETGRYSQELTNEAYEKIKENDWIPTAEVIHRLSDEERKKLANQIIENNGWKGTPLEKNYLALQQVAANEFITGREYGAYAALLGRDGLGRKFMEDLVLLGSWQRWLDGGSGENAALLSYLATGISKSHYYGRGWGHSSEAGYLKVLELAHQLGIKPLKEKAEVMGITYSVDPGTPYRQKRDGFKLPEGVSLEPAAQEKLRVIERPFEKIKDEEIGKFDLITDVWGIFSYSSNPMIVLQRYIDLLNVGGTIYIHSDNVWVTDDVSNPKDLEVVWNNGIGSYKYRRHLFGKWLKSQNIKGLDIETNENGTGMRIKKTGSNAVVPRYVVGELNPDATPSHKTLVRSVF